MPPRLIRIKSKRRRVDELLGLCHMCKVECLSSEFVRRRITVNKLTQMMLDKRMNTLGMLRTIALAQGEDECGLDGRLLTFMIHVIDYKSKRDKAGFGLGRFL